MAFTTKLTDALAEACEIARADNASMYAFILKNEGADAQSFATCMDTEVVFCILATMVENVCEATGLSRKEIYKILERTMRKAGPLKKVTSYE